VGFNICNSWVGLAATMVIGIEQGGTVTVLYGMMLVLITMGCSATTMAELSSVYPTAGGPCHWTSILAPQKITRQLVGSPLTPVSRDLQETRTLICFLVVFLELCLWCAQHLRLAIHLLRRSNSTRTIHPGDSTLL
jgi:amino acid transporter